MRDHMSQVLNRCSSEGTLGLFEMQLVGAQDIQDRAQSQKVLRPRGAVDEDVVEEQARSVGGTASTLDS